MFADRFEHLTDEAVRRPVGETDAPPGPAYPQHFARGAALVGTEHSAEGGRDRIEGPVGEGKFLSVGFPESDRKAFDLGPLASPLQEALDIVRGDHVAPAAGGGERKIAVAGSDIEHLLAGAQVERFGELFADNLERGADDGVVARRPGRLLLGLDRSQIWRCGLGMALDNRGH